MHETVEAQLLRDLIRGDEGAFRILHAQYKDRLLRYITARGFTTEEAKDIFQDTFQDIWERRSKLVHVISFGGYLFTMARNKCADFYGKKIREREMQEGLSGKLQQAQGNYSDPVNIEGRLQAAIAQIRQPACRRIASLSFIKHYSEEKIAAELNISIQVVKNQLSKSRKLLRNILKK